MSIINRIRQLYGALKNADRNAQALERLKAKKYELEKQLEVYVKYKSYDSALDTADIIDILNAIMTGRHTNTKADILRNWNK